MAKVAALIDATAVKPWGSTVIGLLSRVVPDYKHGTAFGKCGLMQFGRE